MTRVGRMERLSNDILPVAALSIFSVLCAVGVVVMAGRALKNLVTGGDA